MGNLESRVSVSRVADVEKESKNIKYHEYSKQRKDFFASRLTVMQFVRDEVSFIIRDDSILLSSHK